MKILLAIVNSLISSIDNDEEHVMHSKSHNIEVMINDEAVKVIGELFDLLKNRYQNNLESMKGNEFIFNCVYFLYYKCHKTNPSCGGSYIFSWLNKKQKNSNKFHQWKRQEMFSIRCNSCVKSWKNKKRSTKITKFKSFINKITE